MKRTRLKNYGFRINGSTSGVNCFGSKIMERLNAPPRSQSFKVIKEADLSIYYTFHCFKNLWIQNTQLFVLLQGVSATQ